MPNISIVIPVKNGMDTLPDAIAGIQKQSLFSQCELVVVDSGSTDGSVEFLKQFPFVRVIPIDPATFNHGATRNLGVQHAIGEFVVMTVQDAVPSDNLWLQHMVRHFDDPQVMGVCGQQIVPHDADKNPHEWFRPQSQPSTKTLQFKSKAAFDTLTPQEKQKACSWDDVNAMYRKSAMDEVPFQTTVYGEDMLWAKTALELGMKIVYDTAVRVNHYHYQFPDYTYKRVLISCYFNYTIFGYFKPRNYSLKKYLMVVLRNIKWQSHPKWIRHNFNMLYYSQKASTDFMNAIKNKELDALEKKLALNIPLGTQHKS